MDIDGRAVGHFAATLGPLAIALLAVLLFNILSFAKLHRHGDAARYAVSWLKASGVLTTLLVLSHNHTLIPQKLTPKLSRFIIFWLAFLPLQYKINTGHAYSSATSMAIAQTSALWNLIVPIALGTLLVTQVELVLGLRYASSLSQAKSTSGEVRLPRAVSRLSYLVVVIMSAVRFILVEYAIVGAKLPQGRYFSLAQAFTRLSLATSVILLVLAMASLVHAFVGTRGAPINSVSQR